jgi:hypothetical protein
MKKIMCTVLLFFISAFTLQALELNTDNQEQSQQSYIAGGIECLKDPLILKVNFEADQKEERISCLSMLDFRSAIKVRLINTEKVQDSNLGNKSLIARRILKPPISF